MNLQQVFLRLFLLSQISQDTFQQLQTQKHRQTLETSQDLKYTSTFIHHLPNHFLPISPILSAGCRGSPLFFLLPWDRRLTPSYSPRGRPSASGAPGGVWKHSVLTTIPIMLLQERMNVKRDISGFESRLFQALTGIQVSWELELFQTTNWDSAVSQVRLNWVTETRAESQIASLQQVTPVSI